MVLCSSERAPEPTVFLSLGAYEKCRIQAPPQNFGIRIFSLTGSQVRNLAVDRRGKNFRSGRQA